MIIVIGFDVLKSNTQKSLIQKENQLTLTLC